MAHTFTKKARGHCPHLNRDHSIGIQGSANLSNDFKKEKMNCSYAGECGSANDACPIYQKV